MEGVESNPARRLSLTAGEILFRRGEAIDLAYVIDSGRVETFEVITGGVELSRGCFEPGAVLGLPPEGGPPFHETTARAVETTVLTIVDGRQSS